LPKKHFFGDKKPAILTPGAVEAIIPRFQGILTGNSPGFPLKTWGMDTFHPGLQDIIF